MVEYVTRSVVKEDQERSRRNELEAGNELVTSNTITEAIEILNAFLKTSDHYSDK